MNKKIAICFSGQLRGGLKSYFNIKKYFGSWYDCCTFFAHIWDINTRKPYVREPLNYTPETIKVNNFEIEKFQELYNIESNRFQIESYDEFQKKSFDLRPPIHLYYSWKKSIDLMNQYSLKNNINFDLIIKLRPDIIFDPVRSLYEDMLKDYINNPSDTFYVENLSLESSKKTRWFNDVFWISNTKIMNLATYYVDDYVKNKVDTLYDHLENNNIELKNIGNGYACLKLECINYDPIIEYDKIKKCEDYHFSPHFEE